MIRAPYWMVVVGQDTAYASSLAAAVRAGHQMVEDRRDLPTGATNLESERRPTITGPWER